jgi:putative flippase GtrA
MRKPLRFLLTGCIGFVVDATVLALLLAVTRSDPFTARLLSIAAALLVTWMLNRRLTFGPSDRALIVEGARYGGVGTATSLVNYGVYSALLLAFPETPPLTALVLASATAMVFSYLGYCRLVFDR